MYRAELFITSPSLPWLRLRELVRHSVGVTRLDALGIYEQRASERTQTESATVAAAAAAAAAAALFCGLGSQEGGREGCWLGAHYHNGAKAHPPR